MEFGVITLGDNRPDVLTGRLRTAVEHHEEGLQLAEKAEALGFNSFHVGEHHGCDYITSTPSVVLGAAAARTNKITLSTATALLPVHDAIRFAEDYATVDVLSNGRMEVIVSRGILARSYGDLGFNYDDSRALFKEKIQLVLELWRNENVSWKRRVQTADRWLYGTTSAGPNTNSAAMGWRWVFRRLDPTCSGAGSAPHAA